MATTTSIRGKGYHRNTDEERAKIPYVGRLLGAPNPRLSRNASLEDFVVVRDQLGTSSCVGQSISQCARVRLLASGLALVPLLSALSVYAPARALDRADKNAPLVDEGCRPAQAVAAVKKDGIATEDAWPFSEESVNFDIPFDVYEDAANLLPYTIGGEFGIDLTGDHLVVAIMHALDERYPVAFGAQVDRAFEDTASGEPVGAMKGPSEGGHMMAFVGYETLPSGVVVFRGVNSWGTSWGDHGLFNATREFVLDPNFGDVQVYSMIPVPAKPKE